MIQAKFSIEEMQIDFLRKYKEYGFKDKSAMLREAIELLKKKIELEDLRQSAELYSELYSENDELRELTESALEEWPK
ncbi:MAG: hypothetical protein GY866_20205 [Proteobacteria bacterium]|nr:hypothetical protein [Pseudomonadota bacterium]